MINTTSVNTDRTSRKGCQSLRDESESICRLVSTRSRTNRNGITLIEVVAGLAMLGTMLTAIMVAAGRFEKQRSRASQRLQAVRFADTMMTTFFSSGFPAIGAQGSIPEHPAWRWEFIGQKDPNAPLLLANVQFKVFDTRSSDLVLASIEVVTSIESLGRWREDIR